MIINLIVGTFYPAVCYGGPIFSTLYTSKELARLGVNVHVSTTNANGDESLNVPTDRVVHLEDKIFVRYYGRADRNAFSWPMLLNVWGDIKMSDIVFLQGIFSPYVVVSLLYATILKKPLMLSPRGALAPWCIGNSRARLKRLWLNCFISLFARAIKWHCTSEQEAADVLAIFAKADISVIPNGIDLPDFANATLLSPSAYTKRFVGRPIDSCKKIISMGRIHRKKGLDILINAFSALITEHPDAILLIAGPDGGELPSLRRQVVNSSLENRVFFVGELSGQDKIDFLANGDLFVLPSHDENFGNVYAESLAAGTPIVASAHTPWRDVEKFGCGKWVNNSEAETALAMKELLSRDVVEMGLRGKDYIRDHFSWPSIALQFKEVFQQILDKRSSECP